MIFDRDEAINYSSYMCVTFCPIENLKKRQMFEIESRIKPKYAPERRKTIVKLNQNPNHHSDRGVSVPSFQSRFVVFKSTYLCIQPVHLHRSLSGPTARTWRHSAPSPLVPFVPLVQKVLQYRLFHLDQCLLKKIHFKSFFWYSPYETKRS